MQKIKSVIIDDETANRNVLGSMLNEYCPEIELLGGGASVEEGYELICRTKPDLIFLDVMMLTQTGFDLLRMFDEFPFHVIFVTAFDEYALQAFDFNAVDYILKPVDHTKLIRAVEKVNRAIRLGENSQIIHFIQSIDEQNQLIKSIPFHQKNKVLIVELDYISHIKADRNYCEVFTTDGQRILSTKSLSDYETLLQPYNYFLRINKSVLINIRHVKEYSKGADCILTMKFCEEEFEVSRRKKSQILSFLRN
ncbi:Sensory transduction protein LytR [compost metagenome]